VDGHVINLVAAFGEQFLGVAIGQPVTQIPAHRNRDHLTREPIAGRSGRSEDRGGHQLSLQGSDPISQRNSPAGSNLVDLVDFYQNGDFLLTVGDMLLSREAAVNPVEFPRLNELGADRI
jgi:hypothetical protein